MKKILYVATLALLLVGCDNKQDDAPNSNEIRVMATLGKEYQMTRVSGTAFEAGDRMGLYAVEYNGDSVAEVQPSANYINNEPLTYNGAVWESRRPLYWSAVPCDFYGLYPYQELTSLKDVVFEVATDQSQESTAEVLGGYEASDLLWAKAEKVSQSDGDVRLRFNHMMSRMVVKVEKGPKFDGKIPDDIVCHIYNTATTALVDYTIGSVEKYVFSDTKTIKMHKIDNMTFEAIVVPQFIERTTPLVEITMGGIAYLLEYSLSLRPGRQHTITITLNTSPDQEKIEISIDGSTDSWE